MKYDAVIVGGGIVGLATALRLKQSKPELQVLILEKEQQVAAHQTGHNSGVIHSGIYYKPGSLKARNCIEGYHQLLAFCDEQSIPFERCGKVIVATRQEQLPALEQIYQRGVQNGLAGLRHLTREEVRELEPHCSGIKGVFVPQTGIVDYKIVAEKMADVFCSLGGSIHFDSAVTGVKPAANATIISTKKEQYETRLMINCAGLYCDKIAAMAGQNLDVRIIPFRGEYYAIRPEQAKLVKNLIYPVPDPNFPFLGVHFTRRISGEIEAGPNAVLAYSREGYTKSDINWGELWESLSWKGFRKVASKYWQTGLGELYRSYSKRAFTKALQELVPEIKMNDLEPAGAGVRAQACDRNGGLIDDFVIREDVGCIHVLNAPSPAATSSLSIGNSVSELALNRL
ncbi:MAG: L-2-hydroxyglutarate oxidase [Bacteroidota bacterium]|jgi:L-2-hydroxyglutarate oxidase